MVHWLRLCTPNTEGLGSIPGQVTKISNASQHGQKKNNYNSLSIKAVTSVTFTVFCQWEASYRFHHQESEWTVKGNGLIICIICIKSLTHWGLMTLEYVWHQLEDRNNNFTILDLSVSSPWLCLGQERIVWFKTKWSISQKCSKMTHKGFIV